MGEVRREREKGEKGIPCERGAVLGLSRGDEGLIERDLLSAPLLWVVGSPRTRET